MWSTCLHLSGGIRDGKTCAASNNRRDRGNSGFCALDICSRLHSWRPLVGGNPRCGFRGANGSDARRLSRQHVHGGGLWRAALGGGQRHRVAAPQWTDARVERGADAVALSRAGWMGALRIGTWSLYTVSQRYGREVLRAGSASGDGQRLAEEADRNSGRWLRRYDGGRMPGTRAAKRSDGVDHAGERNQRPALYAYARGGGWEQPGTEPHQHPSAYDATSHRIYSRARDGSRSGEPESHARLWHERRGGLSERTDV